MKLVTQRFGDLSESHAGCLTLTAETRVDARLLGILGRLIECGTSTREGLEVLLEIVATKAKQSRSGGREK